MKLLSFGFALAMASSVMAGDEMHQITETQADVSKVCVPYQSNKDLVLSGALPDDFATGQPFGKFGLSDLVLEKSNLRMTPAFNFSEVQAFDFSKFLQTDDAPIIETLIYAQVLPSFSCGGGLDPKVFADLCTISGKPFTFTGVTLELYKKKSWWRRLLCCC